jgi:hypothetical protein
MDRMFMFFHALALALGLLGGFGDGGFSHVGGTTAGAPMAPNDGGGSMPSTGSGDQGGG